MILRKTLLASLQIHYLLSNAPLRGVVLFARVVDDSLTYTRSEIAMLCHRLTAFALVLLSPPASADVYKCRQADGTSVISNSPCSDGSKTVKTVANDTISAANREQAEKDADRLEEYADKLEARRLAQEEAERKERERLATIAASTPVTIVQPVNVQQPPYYGSPTYILPPPRYPQAKPQPDPAPPAAITPAPIGPSTKPANIYQAPGKYQSR
jgi:hypothetical protein